MSQSRKGSLFESIVNVVVGYGISLIANAFIFTLMGIHLSFKSNAAMGAFFTVVSIVRSYCLRRLFNRHTTAGKEVTA